MVRQIKVVALGVVLGWLAAMGLLVWAYVVELRGDVALKSAQAEVRREFAEKHGYTRAVWVKQEDLDRMYAVGFAEGKAAMAAGMKPERVVEYVTETKEVPIPCSEAPVTVRAMVHEAQVKAVDGEASLTGKVQVNLRRGEWYQDVDLPMKPTSVKFTVVQPLAPANETEPVVAPRKWHLGKIAFGCGPAVYAGAQAWPSASAGVGVGVACVVKGIGVVK